MTISVKHESSQDFFAIFTLGIISALQHGSINIDEAWNWGLNLKTLKYIKTQYGENYLERIVHLGTELESVKRIIPQHFDSSCEEIKTLCHEALLANNKDVSENDYYLFIE